MTINARLRIATRIHFALLRHLGEGIDVGTMLTNEAEAREVLWVCDAVQDAELNALAKQYRHTSDIEIQATHSAAGHTVQDSAWSKDSSGFGVSLLPAAASSELPGMTGGDQVAATSAAGGRWFDSARWLRRGALRPH